MVMVVRIGRLVNFVKGLFLFGMDEFYFLVLVGEHWVMRFGWIVGGGSSYAIRKIITCISLSSISLNLEFQLVSSSSPPCSLPPKTGPLLIYPLPFYSSFLLHSEGNNNLQLEGGEAAGWAAKIVAEWVADG
ncbi:hypothetical protein VNO78_00062 [Psophocarpus tetragonolobus]|uniref:Uncharacterized protein n=1 Tax=Psophocarpus tetragonolobus TaxID=3891 RepID=A0AAN9SY34_PSOTE